MNTNSIKQLYFKDTSFANLMKHRIFNVLLYASKYDAFSLEEDGRVDELIFNEYTSLNLRYPPRFKQVDNEKDANKELKENRYDLIISMPSGDSINPFEWAKKVKESFPDIPIVVLTPFSKMVSERIQNEDLSAIDYVFSWLGNSDLLLAIVKLIEDTMNVAEDVQEVGVQVILLVEDSIRFYSALLPHIYKYVFHQSRSFMTEALNEHEQMLRMRGRPKVLLARSYEEAMQIYNQYKNNMSGVITDVSYIMNGVKDDKAGVKLCQQVRKKDKHLPLIMLSTDKKNAKYAQKVNSAFVHKLSSTYIRQLRSIISNYFGFGDFTFFNPITKKAEKRISNSKGLQDALWQISDESLYYHFSRNDISKWLYSRALFPLAEYLKSFTIDEFSHEEMEAIRQFVFDAILSYRKIKNQGVVAVFDKNKFDKYSYFVRIGEGSMGGKGRGLAFIDSMIKLNPEFEKFENTQIFIPRTLVVCSDIFTEFMDSNNLYPIGLAEKKTDEEILEAFLEAELPYRLISTLDIFLDTISSPLAIRSSSLLEDSHYQPFAGVYSTYMISYDKENKRNMLEMMMKGIKAVYASVFYEESKAYMTATKNVIDEEKMGIILQEVCGKYHNERFYPSFSGVGRSLNFYPLNAEKSEEGIVDVAIGLGKYIVDGGMTLRFSPYYPSKVLQTSTLDLALKETQTYFYAIDTTNKEFSPQVNDSFNLLKVNVQDAMQDGTLKYLASTFNLYDQTLYHNINENGRKVVTFANVLEHNVFPLAEIMKTVLRISQQEMGRPVEIEFSVQLDYSKKPKHKFYILQIRPIVDAREMIQENIGQISKENTIIHCQNAMGHGIYNDIHDVIYVKQENFNASNNSKIALELDKLNQKMIKEERPYILVGSGRWGSSDEWLGIPVKWSQISNAKVIVECGLENYRIDPSQGTHFFQNLTSFGVSYFTINPYIEDGSFDVEMLDNKKSEYETDFIRLVSFETPVVVKVDGRKKIGIVMKPNEKELCKRK